MQYSHVTRAPRAHAVDSPLGGGNPLKSHLRRSWGLFRLSRVLLVRSWGSLGTFKVPLWRVLLYFLGSGNRVTKKERKSLQNRALRSSKTRLSLERGANSMKSHFSKKVSILVSILESFWEHFRLKTSLEALLGTLLGSLGLSRTLFEFH